MKSRYRVHKLDYKVMVDVGRLETFLNSLEGEIISIFPNVTSRTYEYSTVDFLLIVEKLPNQETNKPT